MKITFANLFFLLFLIIGCENPEPQLTDTNINNLVIDSRFSVEIFASNR